MYVPCHRTGAPVCGHIYYSVHIKSFLKARRSVGASTKSFLQQAYMMSIDGNLKHALVQ